MKIKTVAFVIGVLLLVSCTSGPQIYNPENIQEEKLITIYVHRFLQVKRVDDIDVEWNSSREYTVRISPGEHTLYTKYDNGGWYAPIAMPVTAQFEQGNTYKLEYSQSWDRVSYHIYLYNEEKKGEEVTLKP